MNLLQKIVALFRRGPDEGIYSAISQMAHDSGARYALGSGGEIKITREPDKAVMVITTKTGEGFLVEDHRVEHRWNVVFGFEEDWMMLLHIQKFLEPNEEAAP